MNKWIAFFVCCFLLAACGSDSVDTPSDQESLTAISGNWEIELTEALDPTEVQMKYLSISDGGDVSIFGLDPEADCYKHETEMVTNNGDGTYEISVDEGNLTLSVVNNVLTIELPLAILTAQSATVDFTQFNLCEDAAEEPSISLSDIQHNWEIDEINFDDGDEVLHFFSISAQNTLTSYFYVVDEGCYKVEKTGEVNFVSNGLFTLGLERSDISLTYVDGALTLDDGKDTVTASVTLENLDELSECGQIKPEPDPIENLTLEDIKGTWVYQTDSQSHYVTISQTGLFKRFQFDDQNECYTNISGAISEKGQTTFTVTPANNEAFLIELSKDGTAFQSSSALGDIEFSRSNLTEGELIPECLSPVVIDNEMTLAKLQGSFGGVVDANRHPFSFVTGSLLSFANYDFSDHCYQRQGYWLEELGEGQFKKTSVLTGGTEIVGFKTYIDNVNMINVNTGIVVELGNYVSAGDYPKTGSNFLTRSVNLDGCKSTNPRPTEFVGSWYSELSLSFITFRMDGENLIETKHPISLASCYTISKPEVITDLTNFGLFEGNLAFHQEGDEYFNRVLEKDLPSPCIVPDLTLTLDDVAGLWRSESENESFKHITVQGSMTSYFTDRSDDSCLFKSLTSSLTRLDSGKYLKSINGISDTEIVSFLMPETNSLIMYYGKYDSPDIDKVRAETTVDELNSRVCERYR